MTTITTKTVTVHLDGGYHNSDRIGVRVPADWRERGSLTDNLTDTQRKRLDRHFCGITDCTCGGVSRADITD
jgi:hypothetical protein